MIRVIINNNLHKDSYNLDENMTLRQALETNGVDYSVGVVSLDGSPLRAGDMDKTFADFGIAEKCHLSVVVKADNAASIKIIARNAVLEAGFTLEALKKVSAKRPKSLVITDDKDNEVFCVGLACKGAGSVNSIGISFAPVAAVNGNAMMTVEIPADIEGAEKAKDWVAEKFGTSVIYLQKIEELIPAAVKEIDEETAKVKACITAA